MALVLACRLLPFLVQPVTLFVCSAYSFFLNVAHFWPTIIKRCWTFEPQFLLSARQTRHGLSSNLVGHQHWIYWTVYVVGLSNLHGEYVVNGLGSSFHGKYICGLVVNLACCSQPGSRLMMLLLSGAPIHPACLPPDPWFGYALISFCTRQAGVNSDNFRSLNSPGHFQHHHSVKKLLR